MHQFPLRFTFLLFIAVSLLLFQKEVKAGYFEKVYGNDVNTTGVFFAKTADHGVIILGNAVDSVPHNGYYLLKIDSDGVVVWEKKFIDVFDAFSYSITTLKDGKIVLLGTHTGVLYQIVAEVMVFDSAGNFLNTSVYPPFNGWGTAGVTMTNSGDSSVSIIIYNDGFISNNYYSVYSLNPDLSTKWSDFVSFDGSFTQAHGITTAPNGHVYTMSYYEEYFYGTIPLFRVTHIREHDSDGVLLLDSLYEFNCITNAICVTSDSGVVICGVQDTSLQKDIVVIRIDSSGNIVWQKQFGSRLDEESNTIIQTSDGGFAILSTVSDSVIPGMHDIQLCKLSSNGDSLWSRQFGGTLNESGLHIQEDITDLIILGSTDSFKDDQIYLIRTDSAGLQKTQYSIDFAGRYFCENDTVTLQLTPPIPSGSHVTWSNGDTLNPTHVIESGNYYAVITDSNGVSVQTAITPVYFSSHPNAYFGPDTLSLCSGVSLYDSAVFDLTNTYQWYLNDTILPGETYPYFTPQFPGRYQLVVNNYCGSDTGISYVDTLNDLPSMPVITAPSIGFVCAGDSLPLSITYVPGETYQWYYTDFANNYIIPGETDTIFYADSSGWYLVEAINANGCSVFSWTQSVFYDLAKEFISPNGPTHFCQGGEVELSVSNGSNYLWSNGGTTQAITVNNSGAYFVFFINQNNCPKISDTISIAVFNNPVIDLGVDTNICSSDSLLLDPGAGYSNYFWNDGSANPTLFAFSGGPYPDTSIYFVSVLDTNGCTNGDTVSVVFDICIGIDKLALSPVLLYPNPSYRNEKVSILGLPELPFSIKITDVLGREVISQPLIDDNKITLSDPGLYFYFISYKSRIFTSGKLMIN